jgi:DNA-binding protein Fis
MTLGELKKALKRFSRDLDDSEVLFVFKNSNENIEYDLLTFIAYADLNKEKNPTIILGTMKAALQKMKDGTLNYSEGKISTHQSFGMN